MFKTKNQEQFISVPFRYPVVFSRDVFALDNDIVLNVLAPGRARLMVFADEGVQNSVANFSEKIEKWVKHNSEKVELVAPVQKVIGGEQIKNDLEILDRVGRLAMETSFCRHSYILIIGGGAVLDAVGFAAATVHRGIRQIRFPSTTLSQDDSGVGVKCGVNRFGQKNYYGTFAPPFAVVNDLNLLNTQPQRDWLAGVSEAFKVAIIEDAEFLNYMLKNAEALPARDESVMERVVIRSAQLHLEHIKTSGDPFEAGQSRPLDFGHWVAHKLETLSDHSLRHGEAVSIGMAVDLQIAAGLGLVSKPEAQDVSDGLMRAGLPVWSDLLLATDSNEKLLIWEGLEEFRAHLGGALTLAMPNGLGRKTDIHSLSYNEVVRAVNALQVWYESI